jgi:hypothetical protein
MLTDLTKGVLECVWIGTELSVSLPVIPLDIINLMVLPTSCCTVNHPQGWPKFISNAFLTTPDQKSLIHLYLGPFTTSVLLASSKADLLNKFQSLKLSHPDNRVTASVDTLYPFGDTLTTTITAAQAFTYYVRIPSWVVGGTIAINGAAAKTVTPTNGLQAVSVAAGTTKFVLNLPALITTGMLKNKNILRLLDIILSFRESPSWLHRSTTWPATLRL